MDTSCELARETWSRYFDELGSELRSGDVSIEVSAAPGAAQLPSVLRRLMDHAQRITVDSTSMAPMRIVADDRHGVRTLVIERPAAFGG